MNIKTKINKGFTLIELMITVAIMGIILTIALPAYSDYILSAKAQEGRMAILSQKVRMEQHYLNNNTYMGACDKGSAAEPAILKNFKISCSTQEQTFTLTATGLGFTYAVDQSFNQRTITAPKGWKTGEGCLISSKGDSC